MPFRSKAQRRYMHAYLPDLAEEWESYPNKNLPEKVKKKRSKMRNRKKPKRT
jgi:hypothetical protein